MVEPVVKRTINRFNAIKDLVLLEQVQHHNPYASDDSEKAWKNVVDALNEAKTFPKAIDVRAVKDRLSNLIASFQAEDIRARSKSGTAEQYDRLKQMLTDIHTLVKDAEVSKKRTKLAAEEKAVEQQNLTKFMKSAGEIGRTPVDMNNNDNLSDSEDAMNEWLKSNGGDQLDWEGELDKRRGLRSSVGEPVSSSNTPGRKLRGSKLHTKEKAVDSDLKFLEYMREQDDKKFKLKEKKAADDKEIRLKELELEEKRLRIEARKWEYLAKTKSSNDVNLLE